MLDNTGKVALYEQLKLLIKDDILKGKYIFDEKLPTENQLCETYKVSRITVRRAIKELREEGLVEVRQGRGTFVSNQKMNLQILDISGYTDGLPRGLQDVQLNILDKKVIEPDNEVCKALNLKEGFRVLELTRLIRDKYNPISIDIAYFPLNLYPGITDKIKENVSTFDIIKNDYGIILAKAYKEFSVVLAQNGYDKILNCTPSEPLFNIKKTVYNLEDQPVHFSKYYIHASKVKYCITVDMNTKK